MLNYTITAHSAKGGEAHGVANNGAVRFDASVSGQDGLPNPTELLLTALAACMLKNVERFSEILKFDYETADIEIYGVRNDSPPFISEITYTLTITSDMEERTKDLLHRNILKFGTITNTLARSTQLNGTLKTTYQQ
ncbi:MAG: OsmC family protein [Flavobacteriales bacterium]|nr:OsmC family protein [Flavobacteriales bacterium]MBK6943211.1 OsmC family protein [Flavobacteriales bacterium]MBK7240906.1 OsmC family protein [Flavobacteriales bacterium]MBK7296484.1 OsmC family protein [Flavobacteriales bacterium]MBK9536258.1 OsmC family protein [Flavobacteriales bacterium]